MSKVLLNIENLLYRNTFFEEDISKFQFIESNCDESFGEGNILMYYFYYSGYYMSFVCDREKQLCKAEQIEISELSSIENPTLKSILLFNNFCIKYSPIIESIYKDEEEMIIFLQSGVNVYFREENQKYYLKKIISFDQPTRELIIHTMEMLK